MEEQKNLGKEVKMQPIVGGQPEKDETPKMTYEQLQDVANRLFNENKALRQQNMQMQQTLMGFDRLFHLLKVIEIANSCRDYSFNTDFVQQCICEVEELMTPSSKEQSEEDKEN